MVSRYREEAASTGYGLRALRGTPNTTDGSCSVQLVDGGRSRRFADGLPAALPLLDGGCGCGGQRRRQPWPWSCSRPCSRCSAHASTPWPRSGCSAPPIARPAQRAWYRWRSSYELPEARRRSQHCPADRPRAPLPGHQVHQRHRERAATQRECATGRSGVGTRISRRTGPRRCRSWWARPPVHARWRP